MYKTKKVVACLTVAVILATLTIQPVSAAPSDFKINGGVLVFINIGEEYQLNYVTSGIEHEFMSTNNFVFTVDQNGLMRGVRLGSAMVYLQSLDGSRASAVMVTVSNPGPKRYAVSYTPGTHGAFPMQTYNKLVNGTATPGFVGTPEGNLGYKFAGWSPEPSATVAGSARYVAQWERSFSSTLEVNAYSGCGYQLAILSKFFSEFTGRDIVLKYDNTVFNATAMSTHPNLTFTQISPGAIKFSLSTTVTEGAIGLLSLNATKTENSIVKMYSY